MGRSEDMAEFSNIKEIEGHLPLAAVLADGELTSQEKLGGNIWHISISLMREDGVWLGIAAAFSETGGDAELRSLRYGLTPEEAVREALHTLRETILLRGCRADARLNRP
jgi:hypothetical protein